MTEREVRGRERGERKRERGEREVCVREGGKRCNVT